MDSANTVRLEDLAACGWLQRYWIKSWLRRQPIYVRMCRLLMQTHDGMLWLRLTYVTTRSDYSLAERNAEEFIGQLILTGALGSGKVLEAQWKRGRFITYQSLDSESDCILRGMYRLWRTKANQLVIYEKVNEQQTKPPSAESSVLRSV